MDHTSFQWLTRAPFFDSRRPRFRVRRPRRVSIRRRQRCARELLETGIYMMAPMVRFYVVPRGTPAARVTLLREDLEKTWAIRTS